MTDKLVTRIEEIALTGDDLVSIANCVNTTRVKWMLYDDLVKFRSVEELFGKDFDSIYILLRIKNQENVGTVGHWVVFIFNRKDNAYYWYDPYGLKIPEELAITHEPDFIVRLIKGIVLDQNVKRHQTFSSDINTCGRHCVVRSIFNHLNNDEYNEKVIRPMVPVPVRTADALVALMTGLAPESDRPLIAFFNKKNNAI